MQQFPMTAGFDNISTIHNKYIVGILYRAQSMSHYYGSPSMKEFVEIVVNTVFICSIQ